MSVWSGSCKYYSRDKMCILHLFLYYFNLLPLMYKQNKSSLRHQESHSQERSLYFQFSFMPTGSTREKVLHTEWEQAVIKPWSKHNILTSFSTHHRVIPRTTCRVDILDCGATGKLLKSKLEKVHLQMSVTVHSKFCFKIQPLVAKIRCSGPNVTRVGKQN